MNQTGGRGGAYLDEKIRSLAKFAFAAAAATRCDFAIGIEGDRVDEI